MTRRIVLVAFIGAIGCDGKEQPKRLPVADATMKVIERPPTPDSAKPDSAKPAKSDSARRADSLAAATKAKALPLRDSAFGPSFKIDEKTGKVTPIKKPN